MPHRWTRLFVLAIGVWLLAPGGRAQAAEVHRVHLLPAGPHHIGDLLELRIELTAPEGRRPEIAVPRGEAADLSWGTPVAEPVGAPTLEREQRWVVHCPVQVFTTGEIDLPVLDVGLGREVLHTAGVSLTVETIRSGPNANAIKDILPPVPIGRSSRWMMIVGVAVVCALAAAFFLARRLATRRTQPREPVATVPAMSPDQWLDEQFTVLEGMEVGSAHDLREYIARLADVVREYLSRKARIPAPHRTTRHTLTVAGQRLPRETTRRLAQLLVAADQVKFAGKVPPADAARGHLATARALCREMAVALDSSSRSGSIPDPQVDTSV